MGGATDARVVVPHDLLAPPGSLVLGQAEHRRGEADQVLLDLSLVLAGGRDDRGERDVPARVGLVAVVEDAARGLGDPRARAGPGLIGTAGASGGSYAAISRSASSTAYAVSRARTTMLT